MRHGEPGDGERPEPVSVPSAYLTYVNALKSWGSGCLTLDVKPRLEGLPRSEARGGSKMGVGLRSHSAPRTRGFGVRDPSGGSQRQQAQLVSGALVPPDVARDTCLVMPKREGASLPGRVPESEWAGGWAARFHCSLLSAPRPGLESCQDRAL